MTLQDTSSSSMQSRQTITAMFDSRDKALIAVEELVAAGIPRSSVRINPETDVVGSTGAYDTTRDEKGFWASLEDLFMPNDDRAVHAEAMHRGSIMVAVTVDQAHVATAENILEEQGTVDLDEREASWRTEGWSAAAPVAATASATRVSDMSATSATSGVAATGTARSGATPDDGVISLYEEKLNVGKRQVSAGRVKIRSYVVETPVNQQVNLRSESVQVERHAVDRPVGVGENLFQDRVIEAEEHAEEAVISKTARVTEEISLRKTADEQTKTISDTVRRTEVEVEDERSSHAVAKTTTEPVPNVLPDRKI